MIHAKGKGMMQTFWCRPKTETVVSSEPPTGEVEDDGRNGTVLTQATANHSTCLRIGVKSHDGGDPPPKDTTKLHKYFI
jgi:hypothetical protein